MKRREVKILGLSYSQSQIGSYVLVLSELKGKVKLPIIIKPHEAQRIALDLEGIKSSKPLTHDLFKSMTDSFAIDVQEVFIYSLAEGVFYAKIISSNGIEEVEIESCVSDGVILSSLYQCPIFVANEVLNAAGVLINDDGSKISEDETENDEEVFEDEEEKTTSIENLEKMLQRAINDEEYEICSLIQQKIDKLKDTTK